MIHTNYAHQIYGSPKSKIDYGPVKDAANELKKIEDDLKYIQDHGIDSNHLAKLQNELLALQPYIEDIKKGTTPAGRAFYTTNHSLVDRLTNELEKLTNAAQQGTAELTKVIQKMLDTGGFSTIIQMAEQFISLAQA